MLDGASGIVVYARVMVLLMIKTLIFKESDIDGM